MRLGSRNGPALLIICLRRAAVLCQLKLRLEDWLQAEDPLFTQRNRLVLSVMKSQHWTSLFTSYLCPCSISLIVKLHSIGQGELQGVINVVRCQSPLIPATENKGGSLGWPVFQSCAEASISVLHAAVRYRLAHCIGGVRPRQARLLVPVPSSFKFRKYLLIFFLGMSAACVIASIPNHFCEPLHMVHRIITKLSCSKRLCST